VPAYFPENNNPLPLDTEVRSLQKINDLLNGNVGISLDGSGIASDAFGRLRVSNPFTLFDSSHRYQDNALWNSSTATGGAVAFNANQGLVDLTVNSTSGSKVLRETTKVFAYQPGKSLLVLNTFVFAGAKTNLRQRAGYFGTDNGIFLQLDGATLSFVERSLSTGTITVVPQANWNGDKLDGSGASGLTLDISKAQIIWMDFEWLGLGTVRCGFVINGQFITCHSFHHANLITSTYITTASLPLRIEIENTGETSGSSTLKQVCSTVISEGGYQLYGAQKAAGTVITAPYNMSVAGTYYPIVSIRLKSTRLDAIAILTALSVLPGTTGNYNWQMLAGATTSGGSWSDPGSDSSVEYKINGTGVSGGRILASGFISQSNQSNPAVDILKEALFRFQLERNSFTSTTSEITITAAAQTVGGGGNNIFASMDWEEVSR
jgi:hypothetical protein